MDVNDFIRVEHVGRTFEEKGGPLKVLDEGRVPCCARSRAWIRVMRAR